jgi:hypothetical protein
MKRLLAGLLLLLLAIGASAPAQAKGCIKGALIGGTAGHFAGHHGVIGALAGCATQRSTIQLRTSASSVISRPSGQYRLAVQRCPKYSVWKNVCRGTRRIFFHVGRLTKVRVTIGIGSPRKCRPVTISSAAASAPCAGNVRGLNTHPHDNTHSSKHRRSGCYCSYKHRINCPL